MHMYYNVEYKKIDTKYVGMDRKGEIIHRDFWF